MNKKQININDLSKHELYELNERIVARLKEISRQEAAHQVSKYKMTDIVEFTYEGKQQYGVVKRVNQKSLSLELLDGSEIRVHPSFVKKVTKPPKKVVELRKSIFPTPKEMLEEMEKEGLIIIPK